MRNNFNPWHQVVPQTEERDVVKGIIEIPKGTKAKYELDKESGLLRLDRVLFSSMYYPHNYGFIPQSYCDDHDPLDILILSQTEVVPLCIVEAKVIGVMRMLDNGEADDKIIAVAAGDPSVNHYNDISELPQYLITETMSFFEDYLNWNTKPWLSKNSLIKKLPLKFWKKVLKCIRNTSVSFTSGSLDK